MGNDYGDDTRKHLALPLDAVQFGIFMQKVNGLDEKIDDVKADMSAMRVDVADLKDTRSKGWGILIGVTSVAGGLGSITHSIFEKLMR